MRRIARSALLPVLAAAAALGLGTAPLAAAPARAVDPTYAALRGDPLDGRTVKVSGLVLSRDVFRFQLDSGELRFLAPVEGHAVGAVFRGHGSYRLVPATEEERRELALQTAGGEKFETLTDDIDEMVLWFGDDTAAEIERAGTVAKGAVDREAAAVLERARKRLRKDFRTNVALRQLAGQMNPGAPDEPGLFLAYLPGKRLPPALAAVDPRGIRALGFDGGLGGAETVLEVSDEKKGGLWYLSHLKREVEAHEVHPPRRLADDLDYRVDSRVTMSVADNPELAGTTTVKIASAVAGLRLLPIDILPRLRLESAEVSSSGADSDPGWKPAVFIQEDKDEDADAAVLLPAPLGKGATAFLRLAYRGTGVLHDAGDRNYVVGARSSWYPNLGVFSNPATYELRYRIPKGYDLVSVGTQIESHVEGGDAVSTWTTDLPIRVAGFNFGKFKKVTKTDPKSGFAVDVYAAATTPSIVYYIDQFLASQGGGDDEMEGGAPGAEGHVLKTDRLTDLVLAQALFADRVYTAYFGPLPDRRIAITQQSEWNYGQSWPALIFLPYMAFLPSIQRAQLGLSQASDFVEAVCFHELAHQWWGHLVGWGSYEDQWLSEGFAEFSAALSTQLSAGPEAYDHFWKNRRKAILERHFGDAVAPNDAAPISLGYRASTHRSPSAFLVIYAKGAYVLAMLRTMMVEPGAPEPDARFIAMMKDFVSTYTRKNPTTADFQKVVERHMTPEMDVAGNHRMDWFFDQWVRGTEVPRYKSDLAVKKEGDKYRIAGKVAQQGVSDRFVALVPVDLDFGKGKTARLGTVRLTGSSSVPVDVLIPLPREPRRAVANLHGEVLSRD
jgi:hypothetical protein